MMLLLLGCVSAVNPRVLPVQLSLLVERSDGTPLSVVLELNRSLRDQLDLRVAKGRLLYDGRHIWEVNTGDDGLSVRDQVSGREIRLPLIGPLQLLGMDRRAIWVKDASGNDLRCGMEEWPEWSESPSPPDQRTIHCDPNPNVKLFLSHPGPGSGFAVEQQEDRVYVRLPTDEQGPGTLVLHEVSRVLGVHWVRDARQTPRPLLERLFRGQATITATAQHTDADGFPGEWADVGPLVVQEEWHLESGGASWGGHRDASFSVAAAHADGQICFAGRLRDDDRQTRDALLIWIGARRWELPLGLLKSQTEAQGQDTDLRWHLARDWYGARYEACVVGPGGDRLPFAMSFIDVDENQAPTILSTAPHPNGLSDQTPLGLLLLLPPVGS
jgi:hypothetical protein